jgi:hypothetical protein
MTYYGSDSRQTEAYQIMKRISDKVWGLGCHKVIHIETSDIGGERLVSKATEVEIAHLDGETFQVLFSNPRGEESPFLPGGLPNPVSVEQLIDVINAIFRWLKEEATGVPAGEHSVYEGRLPFYVTFGQTHPLRDGYVVIYAYTDGAARAAAFDVLGQKWSSLSRVPCDSKSFPDGACGHPIIADDHEP